MDKTQGHASALFLDRDGVLNDLVYYKEEGRVGSPLSAAQLKVSVHAGEAVKKSQALGLQVIVISNQPGVAKKQFSYRELSRMNAKIASKLASEGVRLDGEYYCLHHPNALIAKYKIICDCRKPKPGLLLRAAREHELDLRKSFFAGDSLIDIQAGKAAGCNTILVATMTDLLNRVIVEENAKPDYMVANVSKIPNLLEKILKKE
ncbi:MAG: D-glycero-alpha-D-manno-heptose-1,7-bisphosphate 7-phosphatase [Nitrososphaerales archaeon]